MVVNLNGSGKDREMEALDILLKGKPDDYKGRVLEFVRKTKVDANDPIFILMAALGNLDVALVDLPKEFERNKQELRQEIDRIATDLRGISEASKKDILVQGETIKATLKQVQTKIDRLEVNAGKLQLQIDEIKDAQKSMKEQAENLLIAIAKYRKELSRGWKKIEDRDLVSLWDIQKWKVQHWLFAMMAILSLMTVNFSWRTQSDLNKAIEQLRFTNQELADISQKSGYHTIKLERLEQRLGTKPKK